MKVINTERVHRFIGAVIIAACLFFLLGWILAKNGA